MIRTNLSTRPFYNERVIRFWLLGIAALVGMATLYNVSRIIQYTTSDQQLARQAALDESRAADFRQQGDQLRATVNPKQIENASAEARQANELIDRRTFSWTEVLNRLETTLPDDVHIAAIRPRIDKKTGIVLTMNVVAKSLDDTYQFIGNLEGTGSFVNVLSIEDRVNEEGLYESTLQAVYRPDLVRPSESTPAPSGPPGGRSSKRTR